MVSESYSQFRGLVCIFEKYTSAAYGSSIVAPIIRYFTLGKYERINRKQLSPTIYERRRRMLEVSKLKMEWKDKPVLKLYICF